MKKNILSVLILISGILISGGIISLADAQTTTPSDIQYPILELGNCKSKNDCKVFCDNSKNSNACLTFAEQHNLMSSEELANAKRFIDKGMVGPGGCKGQVACEQYCGVPAHLEECTAFAEKNGMMTDQELQDSKKVLVAIKNGLKPPACVGSEKCNTYCSNPAHMEECMTFSIAAGIVPDDQKEQMQKTLDAIKQGAKPPACQPNPPSDQLGQTGQNNQSNNGLQSCDEYCGTHMEECMSFSLATGMVPDDQKEQMQKTLTAFKQGIKPPACQPNPPEQSGQPDQTNQPNQPNQPEKSNRPRQQNKPSQSGQGLQACDQYCVDPSHVEECVKFSVAMGNMTEEQGQNSIKNGGKGPGGCIGKDACDTFCNNPDNQDACFNFAKDNGMIPPEDLQKMQDGQPGQGGSMKPGKNQSQQQGQSGDKFQPGPETVNSGGQRMPQQAGPGGCKGPEECQKYCASNPEVCKNFQPQQNQQSQPNQPGQPNQFNQLNQLNQPNQINQPSQQPDQFNQGQPGQIQPQQQPQSPIQQQNPPPPPSPSSFLQRVQNLLANVLSALK